MSSYFNFDGTNTRSQYWGITIGINIIVTILASIGTALIVTIGPLSFLGFVILIATIVSWFWVVLANIIKRCRDSGLSPMWAIGTAVPPIGLIVYIVIGCLPTKSVE
jgi:uncharacterized membrane protein YhaH (DUF805 family)